MKAIRIHAHGGPEVLQWEEVDLPAPGPSEVRIRHTAIGVNFSDANVRRGGFYIKAPRMPVILGNEAAGVVECVGRAVTEFSPGDRVAYAGMHGGFYEATGAYAQERNVPADRLVKIPASVSDEQAAAMLVKGLTASSIVNRVFRPKRDDTILIHAAASGVGLLLCQWAKHLGAQVIGTVGSATKAEVAWEHGCDHTILYRESDFVQAVRALAPNGVSAVFDGVGKDTFMRSLDCVRPFGMLVNYGNASGPVPPVDLILLAEKGSLSVSRPGLHIYAADTTVLRQACAELFDLVGQGILKVVVHRSFPLHEAALAHREIENGAGWGSMVLIP